MDWPSIIVTLLILLAIQGFGFWWFTSTRHFQQTSVGGTNGARVVDEKVTQNQDETESGPAIPSTGKGTPSLNIPPSDPPPYGQDVRLGGEVTTASATERNETENPQVRTSMLPGTAGFFNHAQHIVVNRSVMVINETEEKVLQWLAGFTLSGAEFDARGHVPSCHPGTRIAILEKLHHWIDDPQRVHRVLWLRGPAGVGKSAIVQSFAEGLAKASKLGASLFFSRPSNRDNPAFVFPTLAYQLAVRIPRYKEYLRQKMVEDPKLLEKEMIQQFNILIVDPFTNPNFAAECGTWTILLDGLDECYGEDAQALIITLVSYLSLQYPGVPLVWLIASRPEAHLRHAFGSDGVRGSFEEHDVPANSDEGCRDVEKFLRAKFEEIRQKYNDLLPAGAPWPVEQDITRISGTSLGLFALATTVVRYIEDPHACDPISQLATVVSVTGGLEPGSLSTLHALYSAILDGVPKAMVPILRLLLHFYAISGTSYILDEDASTDNEPLVVTATLFGLQQHTVYGALRRLHSVIKVPPPEDSGRRGIRFYHASFPDYLKVVSGEYKRDLTDLMTRVWWGFFKMLHEGDSSSYRRAISGGGPPIQFSWDSHFADGFLDEIWVLGIVILVHFLIPECLDPEHFDHTQATLTETELQNVFEKIDFSALLFQRKHKEIFSHLCYLFDWLVSNAPQKLVQSDLVKMIPLGDLDLACIPEEKLAHEFLWTSGALEGADGIEGPRRRQFYHEPRYRDSHRYTNAPSESLHPSWHNKTRPLEGLIAKLDQFRSDDPTMQALIVGRGPSRRCVFICVKPQPEEQGSLFYVPYTQ